MISGIFKHAMRNLTDCSFDNWQNRYPTHWNYLLPTKIWLAPRAGKINQIALCDWLPERQGGAKYLDYPRVPQEKIPRKPYNKSFVGQACSVKMAGYWLRSFLRASSRSINTHTKKNLSNIQPSWPHTWSITQALQPTFGPPTVFFLFEASLNSGVFYLLTKWNTTDSLLGNNNKRNSMQLVPSSGSLLLLHLPIYMSGFKKTVPFFLLLLVLWSSSHRPHFSIFFVRLHGLEKA